MIEVFKIISIFSIFYLFLIFPINTFNKKNIVLNYDLYSLNLLINLNILLFFSLLPIPIENYQKIYLLLFFLAFIYKIFNLDFENLFYNQSAFLVFFLSFLIISLSVASNLEFGWDAKYFYYIKTLFFFDGLNIGDIKNFSDYHWHPHFGSYIWAFFWKVPFLEFEYFGRLFYVFIFCFSLTLAIFPDKGNIYLKIILFLVALILLYNYEKFSGLQEILIFSLLIISSRFLYNLEKTKNFKNIIALFLISNLLIWIKSEGLVFAVILMTILTLNKKIIFPKKIIIFVTLIFIIFFKKITYMYLNFDAVSQPYYNLDFLFSLDFEEILSRIGNIVFYLAYYSLKNFIFFLGVITLIFINFNRVDKMDITIFNYYFLFNLLFIFCAYLFREMEIIYSLRTTMDRIIFLSSGFYLYLVILFIRKRLKI